jgi:tRNA-2-methylthio-N6-dimethylallyladenosine synthase
VLEELRELGAQGFKEVMFLGQNVNSYGKDLAAGDFADLLRQAGDIPGIRRIRFMTSHPKDISKKLIDVMAEKPNIMPHLHLPLQSGSDRILQKMNRGYTTRQYNEIVEYARKRIPNITISTDIIVGFPGETEADFQDTLDFMAKIRFDSAFTFQYSKREGTPAAEYDDQVSPQTVKCRFEKLVELQNQCSLESNQKVLGTLQEVLIEGRSEQRPEYLTGRTPENRLVNFSYEKSSVPAHWQKDSSFTFEGVLAKVSIINAQTFSLEGEWVEFIL